LADKSEAAGAIRNGGEGKMAIECSKAEKIT